MPGSGDYFSQYLVDDFNSLDKEMGGSQWFQKEQERDLQKELAEQNELEKGRMDEEKESPDATTNDPFRPTYDRKKSTESKKDRLERIKKEYEHKPFISVGSWGFWDDLRKRRDKRRQVQEQIVDQSLKEGLSANSPNITQEVEQNEPTIMPPQRFGSVKSFCKKAAWEEEDDPDAADWWKPEEERKSTPEGDAQSKKLREHWEKRRKEMIEESKAEWKKKTPEEKVEYFLKHKWSEFILNKIEQGVDPRKLQSNLEHYWGPFLKELGRLVDSNDIEVDKSIIQKLYPKIVYDPGVQQYISTAIERLKPKELGSEVQGLGPEIGGEYDLYGDWIAWIDYELMGGQGSNEKDPKEIESDINQVWDRFLEGTKRMLLNNTNIPEEEWQAIEDRALVVKDKLIEEGIRHLHKITGQDVEKSPSSEELEKWLKSSGAKRFCKRAGKSVFAELRELEREISKYIEKIFEQNPLDQMLSYGRPLSEFKRFIEMGENLEKNTATINTAKEIFKDVALCLDKMTEAIDKYQQFLRERIKFDDQVEGTLFQTSTLLKELKKLEIYVKAK
jgi:hypothetical protein